MLVLPPLGRMTLPHPHTLLFEDNYRIPNYDTYREIWDEVYTLLQSVEMQSPIRKDFLSTLNPDSGFFGFQVHPLTKRARYFNLGISLSLPFNTPVYPVLPGILEYSGYGAVNGYYILLSHPHIQTEDGYILHSMYCHLKKPFVKFTSYQKMLREISLGSYPLIEISNKTTLGIASFSGLAEKDNPVLYLQLSLRKFGEEPIVLDPLPVFYGFSKQNQTHDIFPQATQ